MGLRQRSAEDREVLTEDEDQFAVDGAVAGDHTVARDPLLGHAELVAAVLDEHVPLFERVLVEQDFQPLAGGQLALAMLRVDAALAAAQTGLSTSPLQFLQNLLHAVPPAAVGVACDSRATG